MFSTNRSHKIQLCMPNKIQEKFSKQKKMIATRTAPSDFLLKTRIKGCITDVNHIKLNDKQGFFRTFVTVPAIDKYSHPSTFTINASSPLGLDGQDVDVICLVKSVNIPECHNVQLWLDESSDASDDYTCPSRSNSCQSS
jgi:hypothetical protein